MTPRNLLVCLSLTLCCRGLAAPLFELHEGDRVALVGDGFIEREQCEGWLELAATTQFPGEAVTFRNLGWSADTPAGTSRNGLSPFQAGNEPADEGWKQLQKQFSVYKPNVIVLGYGMASSLPGGQTADEFAKDLERLLDTAPGAAGNPVRFLIVGPPPRFALPVGAEYAGEIAGHRKSLGAIDAALKAIAAQRGIPFVSLQDLPQQAAFSEDGIHLTGAGYRAVARQLEKALGWKPGTWEAGAQADELRKHILKKNEWFFHRSRPANMAYIFGFRDREQGKNAVEIPQFDALVSGEDQKIAQLRDLSKKAVVAEEPVRTASAIAAVTEQSYPKFVVADGYEISLWAENPMMHKPIQMNFDPQGRLWVASSEVYPQVEVGQTANDQIVVLEDSDGDGKADRSKVFASGLLIPTAVIPGDGGCYVAQSTDLLHFKDTDGDGVADEKRRVLSGFGTEDTHHNLHTLRRGPDGSLWMNQSIYTRTDTETPHGIVRLKSGGVMRFDPRSDELKPVFFGWVNPWGHQFDRYGQSFVTDGAGGQGINWAVPGAMYETFSGAPKILGSVSPGSYPKFSSLEIIESSHFPVEWQGSMITCDFRAHRVVRFEVSDQGAGYVAQEEKGDLVRCDDVNFRPIDVKLGPDGALYIADWSNPIINHGEVDFRDPRRDRIHGRIWRLAKKDAAPLAKIDFTKLDEAGLLKALASANRFEREQATAVLFEKKTPPSPATLAKLKAAAGDDATRLAALWLSQSLKRPDVDLLEKILADSSGPARSAAIRVLGDWLPSVDRARAMKILAQAIADEYPRVRLEAMRVLAELPGGEPMDVAFRALERPMDRFLDYALWLGVRQHGEEWLRAVMDGTLPMEGREKGMAVATANLGADKAAAILKQLLPKPLPKDGSGPWLDLVLRTGDAEALRGVYDQIVDGGFERGAVLRALAGLTQAAEQRQVRVGGDLSKLATLFTGDDKSLQLAAIQLAGATPTDALLPRLTGLAADASLDPEVRTALVRALSRFASATAGEALATLADGSTTPSALRQQAALALAANHRAAAVPRLAALAAGLAEPGAARIFWQEALSYKGLSAQLAAAFREKPLPAAIAGLALQHVPDVKEHADLMQILQQQAGAAEAKVYTAADVAALAKLAEAKGDATRGEMIYRRSTLACAACHAIGGAGGKVGPDLTSIGASAPIDYLVESVLLPGLKVKEGYHSIIVETRDGRTLMGQLIRSSGGTSVLRDATGAEITVADSAIVKRTDAGSMMPGNLTSSLFEQEQEDLFKFLSQLGKPGELDATKSKGPRSWAVVPWAQEREAPAAQGDAGLAWAPVTTTVNGRLLADEVATATAGAKDLLAGTKLQLAEASEIALKFPGIQPARIWIDGAAVESGPVKLAAGKHRIVVRYQPTAEPFVMQCEQGTFLTEW